MNQADKIIIFLSKALIFVIKPKQGNRICLSQSEASETLSINVPSFSEKASI